MDLLWFIALSSKQPNGASQPLTVFYVGRRLPPKTHKTQVVVNEEEVEVQVERMGKSI